MESLKFDLSKNSGKFKILNATNGGPWHKRHASDQFRSNFDDYKAARMPYSRNHDSAMCPIYGGPYSHDITCIFPNFDADVNDPESYDFACTDEAILICLDAGTQTFFRLGQTIEHQIKKHGILPPKDFQKWAEICEHIIRHYNEGWAGGYKLNIEYWEIWNEADLDLYERKNIKTWGGTKEQFFDLYEIASKHLKKCFPNIKIGGPACAGNEEWADEFLRVMKQNNAPLDFFSWHVYCWTPEFMIEKAERMQKLMDKNGFGNAENILNEWNYVKDWGTDFVESLKIIHGMKGAAFTMACITAAQHSSIDMLMYYDTRPSVFNGAFDFYTYECLKGYYPLMWYGKFYDAEHEVICESKPEGIYTLCGLKKDGKTLTVVTYYTDEEQSAENKEISIDFGRSGKYRIYLLDEAHDGEEITETEDLTITLTPNSCILIEEI